MPRIAPNASITTDVPARHPDQNARAQGCPEGIVHAALESLTTRLGLPATRSEHPSPAAPVTAPTLVDQLPCKRPDGPSWTEWADRRQAAQLCDTCPVAHGCLLEALRLDAAARRGEDPYGVRGVWGGVWFQPKLWYRPHGLPNSVFHPIYRDLASHRQHRLSGLAQDHG